MFTDTLLGMCIENHAEYDITMAMNGALGGLVGVTDPTEEKVGPDISHHKGAAYDLTEADRADIDEMTEQRATTHGLKDEA